MLEYHQVLEEKRKSRRTIADALEALGDSGNFYGRREIRVNPLPLPSGDTVGLVALFFEVPSRESCWVVSLPTSKRFRGSYPGSGQTVFDIFQLDRAFVDGKGNVRLRDGTQLRAVEVMPTPLFGEPTKRDWRIVHLTIEIIGAEDRCYRSMGEGVPSPLVDMVPDLRFLDCSRLSGLQLPPLKELAYQVKERDADLANISDQKIADALRKFGIRVPRSRPRVH